MSTKFERLPLGPSAAQHMPQWFLANKVMMVPTQAVNVGPKIKQTNST